MAAGKPNSSRPPPGLHEERCTDEEDGVSAAPGSARSLPGGRCPRCGGAGAPPRGKRLNPFLIAGEPLVCADCGLDFEHEPEERKAPDTLPPWG